MTKTFGLNDQVLLCTKIVKVSDSAESDQLCQTLLDSGGQARFIINDSLTSLGLPEKRENSLNPCLDSSGSNINCASQIRFSHNFSSSSWYYTYVYVILKIVDQLPSIVLESSFSKHCCDFKLDNKTFYKESPIDICLI